MQRNQTTKRQEWAYKIKQWKQSGKSARAWCSENHLVYTTFLGWNSRLEHSEEAIDLNAPSNTQFIELADEPKPTPGFFLEFEGVSIHLKPDFDPTLLKKCLEVLRRVSC